MVPARRVDAHAFGWVKPCCSPQQQSKEKKSEVQRDGGVGGTNPHRTAVTRIVDAKTRPALIVASMSTSMEMVPVSNVISLAQRIAARVDARAEAYRKRAMSDDFMDPDETETYRDWKATAREFEQYADMNDMLDSIKHSGLTPRNVRRMRDYVDNGGSAA